MKLSRLYRLGKYDSKSEHPRPQLIKFLRSSVVLNLLSSKNKLEVPIYIKPDLSPFERQKERLILKERRVQIDKGTEQEISRLEMSLCLLTTSSIAK